MAIEMYVTTSQEDATHEKLLALREAIASDCDGFFTNTVIIDELIDLLIDQTSEGDNVSV